MFIPESVKAMYANVADPIQRQAMCEIHQCAVMQPLTPSEIVAALGAVQRNVAVNYVELIHVNA